MSGPKIAPRCGEAAPPPERKTEWKKQAREVSEEEIHRERTTAYQTAQALRAVTSDIRSDTHQHRMQRRAH